MLKSLGIAFLTLAVLQLGFRGAQRVRVNVPAWDFASVYAAARTWVHGGNPYDLTAVVKTWHVAGAFADRDVSYFATVYPPSSLVMIIPLAVLPAGAAMIIWVILTLTLLLLQFLALADMAELKWRDPRTLVLAGAGLASAPLQFGILSGQLSLPAISLCIFAFWCAGNGRETLAGVLLGLACALKPQVAVPFVLYYLLLRRLNLAVVAIAVAAVVWIVAIGAMSASHVDWIHGWPQSMAATTRIGAVNDYGPANRFRDEIVDVKMVLVGLVHSPNVLRLIIAGVVLAMIAWYVRWFPPRQRRTNREELLVLATLSALVLLPVYHRVYDVTLLTIAFAWALAELYETRRSCARAILVALAVNLVPFDSVKSAGARLHFLSALSQKWWWQSLIVPHYAWALLATTILLLTAMSRRAAECSDAEAVEPSRPHAAAA